jgi:hypothetical protein
MAARTIFRNCPDAIDCIKDYKYGIENPLLIQVALTNNTEIFSDCFTEWITILKTRDRLIEKSF